MNKGSAAIHKGNSERKLPTPGKMRIAIRCY
jgi:hypothetical protein